MRIVIKETQGSKNKRKQSQRGGGMDIGGTSKKNGKPLQKPKSTRRELLKNKPVMAKKGKMNKLNPGLKAYLAKKKKTKKKK